jgi:hypothetical protein
MAYWDMNPSDITRDNMYVTGECFNGFIGTVRSYCRGGKFETPVGSCALKQRCQGLPSLPLNSGAFWRCPATVGQAEGQVCTAACPAGFIG